MKAQAFGASEIAKEYRPGVGLQGIGNQRDEVAGHPD